MSEFSKKCNICGEVVKGTSEKHAECNLKQHKITHNKYNRSPSSLEKYPNSHASQNKHEMIKRVEKIRKTAVKLLKNNGFGKSTRKLKEKINKKLGENYSTHQVGRALSGSDEVKKVSSTHHGNRGSTWILKSEL